MTDEDIRSMLRQAIGLAKFLGNDQAVSQLGEVLDDPAAIDAIKEDSFTREVLRKILLMRKLAGKDPRKRKKLEQLEK